MDADTKKSTVIVTGDPKLVVVGAFGVKVG